MNLVEGNENTQEERDMQPPADTNNSGIISRMGLNDNKAGMQGLDKDKINKIILENSIGSKFYENERKKDAQVNVRIQKLLEQVERITPAQRDVALGQVNEILKELENNRDLSRTIVHIDMDAFYASVEERDNPELKDKPMAVGGMGMLSTSNYLARRYGVRAAMPGFIGKKLCPELVLVPTNFPKYTEVSHQIREVIAVYDPNFLPVSLDEAYLDITPYLEKQKSMPEADSSKTTISEDIESMEHQPQNIASGTRAEQVVEEIRSKIHQVTRLTASAGIAPNRLLAKIASDLNKPNGQYYLAPTKENVMEFIRKLPIRKVGGIGKVTEKLLNAVGVETCQDLYDQRAVLYLVFSQTLSSSLFHICLGIGPTCLQNDYERKSISTERTFRDISDPSEMFRKCEELCAALDDDLEKEQIKGMTVTLKLKTAAFELRTRSKTLLHPVGSKSAIYPIVVDLLRQELTSNNHQLKLRLIGVGLSKLSKGSSQQRSIDYFMQKSTEKASGKQITALPGCGDICNPSEIAATSNKCENRLDTYVLPTVDSHAGTEAQNSTVNSGSAPPSMVDSQDEDEQASNCPEFQCPVCSLNFADTTSLYLHVDSCLPADDINKNSGKSIPGHKDDKEVSCLTCPLCNATFCCQDISLKKFNSHVDSCLNRKTILELVRADNEKRSVKPQCRRITDHFSGPPRKRQKTMNKQSCTLLKFFK